MIIGKRRRIGGRDDKGRECSCGNKCHCHYLSVAAVPPSYTVALFRTSRSTSG